MTYLAFEALPAPLTLPLLCHLCTCQPSRPLKVPTYLSYTPISMALHVYKWHPHSFYFPRKAARMTSPRQAPFLFHPLFLLGVLSSPDLCLT